MKIVKTDTRSTTGSNLRNILLLTEKDTIQDIDFKDIEHLVYSPVKVEDLWKIDLVKEIVDVKADQITVENFDDEDLKNILEHICSV